MEIVNRFTYNYQSRLLREVKRTSTNSEKPQTMCRYGVYVAYGDCESTYLYLSKSVVA